jgi:hypothetical protein
MGVSSSADENVTRNILQILHTKLYLEICVLLNKPPFEHTPKIKINIMSMQDPHLSNVKLITCNMLVTIPLSPHYSHPCFTPGPWSSMKLSRDCGTCPWYVRLYVFTALAAIHFKLSFVCVRRMISATPAMQSKQNVFTALKKYYTI